MTPEGEPTTLADENPANEITHDDRVLSLVFRRQAQQSLGLIAAAKELLWLDMPPVLRKHYMDMARREP